MKFNLIPIMNKDHKRIKGLKKDIDYECKVFHETLLK